MLYALLADLVLVLHLAFIAFVVFGAALLERYPRLGWLHLPAVAWAALVEISGRVCPLTPLENHLRRLSGEAGYRGGFVEHYLAPLIYPDEITRSGQFALALAVILINVIAYARLWRRRAGRHGR